MKHYVGDSYLKKQIKGSWDTKVKKPKIFLFCTDEIDFTQRRSNEAYESSSLWCEGESMFSNSFTARFSCY